jgi:hypothetical protein
MIIDYLGSCFIYQQTLHFVSQFHPSSILIMWIDDDSAFISPNGPKSHIICKDWTWTKHTILSEKTFQIAPHMSLNKKLEASLKGLPWGLKRATKKKKKLTHFLNYAAQGKN